MYGIFTYIHHKNPPNVGVYIYIYILYMDGMGIVFGSSRVYFSIASEARLSRTSDQISGPRSNLRNALSPRAGGLTVACGGDFSTNAFKKHMRSRQIGRNLPPTCVVNIFENIGEEHQELDFFGVACL